MNVARTAWLFGALLALGCSDGDTTVAGGNGGTSAGGGGSGGGAGGSAGSGGQTIEPCWGTDPTAWQGIEPIDLSLLAGDGPADPMITADGLSLAFSSHSTPTAPARIYRADRGSLTEPFAGGQPLGAWVGVEPVGHPWLAGNLLFVSFDHGSGQFRLGEAVFDGSAWGFPAVLGPEINDPGAYATYDASASANGRRLVFTRNLGTSSTTVRLFEGVRAQGVAGEPFATVQEVMVPTLDATAVTNCGALSPDGKQLYFSTSHPFDLSGGVPPGALRIWHTQRDQVDAPWQEATHVAVLDSTTHLSCVYALRGDGCEIWVHRFLLGMPETNHWERARRVAP